MKFRFFVFFTGLMTIILGFTGVLQSSQSRLARYAAKKSLKSQNPQRSGIPLREIL
jgi:hypothetical protein